jgi:hypothetical protein
MSDDENLYSRSAVMNRYLYGGNEGQTSSDGKAASGGGGAASDDDEKRRSKSQDSSRYIKNNNNASLAPGTTRIRTKEIERHVKWKNVHALTTSQIDRRQNEKQELNELNKRLDQLVESIKIKKQQNDDLQDKINNYKEDILYANERGPNSKLKKQYDTDLDDAKRELNDISQMSTISKIRASRSMYDLDKLREQYDNELRLQSNNKDKIRMLENQRAESLHEINYLKENCESQSKALIDDADKNEKLRRQLKQLNDHLDEEQLKRVDLECRMQTLLEQRKFDEEIYRLMNEELGRLFLFSGDSKPFDPKLFYNCELRDIKQRIKEDFKKLNEFNLERIKEEYEYRYVQTLEQIDTAKKEAEAARAAAAAKDELTVLSAASLNEEYVRNQEELKALKLNEFKMNQLLDELNNKLNDYRYKHESERRDRDAEIERLRALIESLKSELCSMIGSSKSLDAEVAVYARLLNQKFETNYTPGESSTQFYETYRESLYSGDAERRKREQEELRRRQLELEQHQKRLRELEIEREKERERERIRRQQELEEQRRQRELEEQQRRQRELEEQQRRQRELEEQQRRQRELEEQQRRQRELEEQRRRQREQEEQERRQREREEQEKRQRELEEQRRRQREQEEQERRQREREEQEKRQRELEEQRRRQRELEEQQRRQRELEEQQRRQREYDEQQRRLEEQRRLRELEERRLREIEEQQRIAAEQQRIAEQQRRQRELEEQQRRQRELEEQRKAREYELQQQQINEQIRRQRELEIEKTRELERELERERQRRLQEEQERLQRQRESEIRMQLEEQERQRRLCMEREEREKYMLEKLKQEQELLEIQRRQKLIQEQRERERHELIRQQQQQQLQQQQREIHCVDNISSFTKHVIQENHKSSEMFEEHRVEHVPINVPLGPPPQPPQPQPQPQPQIPSSPTMTTYEKQINIKLPPPMPAVVATNATSIYDEHQQTSHKSISSNQTRYRRENRNNYSSNIVDHCLSSNRGNKHILIVNSYRPKSTIEISNSISHASRSQSPPLVRTNVIRSNDGTRTEIQSRQNHNSGAVVSVANAMDNLASKYAIKHKANRYVSGAIGILETSLNGEYIILENLSSNKNVNLKGWYIHRYVPDQGINVIFKFNNDTWLCSSEKLKILSKSYSNKQQQARSTSMHEGLNKSSNTASAAAGFRDMPVEKTMVATNIENWGTYSKFSVTKLINPDGVDKAVLTQSLLRLASSSSNVNIISPGDLERASIQQQQQQQHQQQLQQHHLKTAYVGNNRNSGNSSGIYLETVSSGSQQSPQSASMYSPRSASYYVQPSANEVTTTTTTTKKSLSSSSSSHQETITQQVYPVNMQQQQQRVAVNNPHLTRQF